MQGPEERLEGLDGLRGVAAIVVLVAHAGAVIGGMDLVPRNGLAVQFFFMLSGFVIAHAYAARLVAGLTVRAFLLRRAIRLYPLIVAGAGGGGLALAVLEPGFLISPQAMQAVLLAALGLPMAEPGFSFGHFPVNPPEWSVFFEGLLSVAFAWGMVGVSTARLLVLVGVALSLYAGVVAMHWPRDIPFEAEPLGALASFGIGVVLRRVRPRGGRIAVSVLAMAVVVACVLPVSLGWGWSILAIAGVFPAVIFAGASARCSPVMRGLGALSYPLYLLHWPVLLVCRSVLGDMAGPMIAGVVGCLGAIAVAWLALHGIDRPMRAWLTGRARAGLTPALGRKTARASAVF